MYVTSVCAVIANASDASHACTVEDRRARDLLLIFHALPVVDQSTKARTQELSQQYLGYGQKARAFYKVPTSACL
jgi:hypothetical protein